MKKSTAKTLAQEIADNIRIAILSGELTGGTKLIEQKLAEQYGVSRIPVREAIYQLEMEGHLERVNFAGTKVKDITPVNVIESHELCLVVSKFIMKEAIMNYTNSTYTTLQGLINHLKGVTDFKEYSLVTWNIAKAIYSPANKPFALSILKQINFSHRRFVPQIFSLKAAKDSSAKLTTEFVNLCKAGKIEEAVEFRLAIINDTFHKIKSVLPQPINH